MKTFESDKTITELGIDTSRKFVLKVDSYVYSKWDILNLERDDNTPSPFFRREWDDYSRSLNLNKLAYYEEEHPKTKIPTHYIKINTYQSPIKKEEWKPVRGERVLVYDDNDFKIKQKVIYLCTIEWAICPHKVVKLSDNEKFLKWEPFLIESWEYIERIQEKVEPLSEEEIKKIRSLLSKNS